MQKCNRLFQLLVTFQPDEREDIHNFIKEQAKDMIYSIGYKKVPPTIKRKVIYTRPNKPGNYTLIIELDRNWLEVAHAKITLK